MADSKFTWNEPTKLGALADHTAKTMAADVLGGALAVVPVRTSNLANSLTSRRDSATPTRVRYVVGTTVFYAPFVEFGTRFMAARPYLGLALEQTRRRFL